MHVSISWLVNLSRLHKAKLMVFTGPTCDGKVRWGSRLTSHNLYQKYIHISDQIYIYIYVHRSVTFTIFQDMLNHNGIYNDLTNMGCDNECNATHIITENNMILYDHRIYNQTTHCVPYFY